MNHSLPYFLIGLVLSRQLMKFSRENHLPRYQRLFRNALIFTFIIFAGEAASSASGTFRWVWHLFLISELAFSLLYTAFRPLRMYVMAFVPYVLISFFNDLVQAINHDFFNSWINYFSTARLLALIWIFALLFSFDRQRKVAEKERIRRQKEEEINRAIAMRKVELEGLVTERTSELTEQKEQLEKTLAELQATQSQLIYSEKMASLGELTAGVAHEMQNPLNFVNNFSEVTIELIDEMKAELDNGNQGNALSLAEEVRQNLGKIAYHGKTADSVVKGMLLHSRKSLGAKEAVDINALAEEYLRLSYFSLRAKDKTFHAELITDFDQSLSADLTGAGKIEIYPQEMGRVILNLINNAFYAVREKMKRNIPGYKPSVKVTTKRGGDEVEIRVKDNGTGIPSLILNKIFQPFFTTKPTGEGTGLGLSLSYDIVTKVHGGELKVETVEGEYSEFIVQIPV
jgi:two-component system, NtrC family, sensor kinase